MEFTDTQRAEISASCLHLLTLLIPVALGLVLSGAVETDSITAPAVGLIAAWIWLRHGSIPTGRHRRDTGI